MTIDEYRRGIPTHQDRGKTIGMLCETKERCITDDDGVVLTDKLAGLRQYTDNAYANSNLYTDTKIGELINGAPTTLDTLKEIADAMEENADVVEALDAAVGSKVDQAEYDGHADNGTIHVTAAEKEAWSKNGGEEIQAIINGTTTVGNANKLDGKSASEYALVSQLFKNQKGYEGLDFNTITETGLYSGGIGPSEVGCANYPTGGTGLLIVYHHANVPYQVYVDYVGNTWSRARFASMAWSEWKQTATTADLANYLPKSGGTIATADIEPLIINRLAGANSFLGFQGNGAQFGGIGFVGADHLVRRSADGTVMKKILDEGNVDDYALPKSGGKVGTASSTPFLVENTGSGNIMIDFLVNGIRQGLLGFNGVDSPIFYDSTHKEHKLLHTGNVGDYAVKRDEASIDTTLTTALTINSRNGETNTLIQFSKNGARQGFIGFKGADVPYFLKSTADGGYPLLHTGNSAKCVVVDTDPGVGASVSYADGTLIFVKE